MTDISLDTLDIHTPELYLERGYPFAEWDYLREHAPIFWYEREDIDPFYAITRHADVLTISKNADVFSTLNTSASSTISGSRLAR